MKNWYYATGKKKKAIAKVFIKIKTYQSIIKINEKLFEILLSKHILYKMCLLPLKITKNLKKFIINIKVKGGGFVSQILAIKHGISKALTKYNINLKKILSHYKFLTRDSRRVERKKLGRHKSRKKKQFSKR